MRQTNRQTDRCPPLSWPLAVAWSAGHGCPEASHTPDTCFGAGQRRARYPRSPSSPLHLLLAPPCSSALIHILTSRTNHTELCKKLRHSTFVMDVFFDSIFCDTLFPSTDQRRTLNAVYIIYSPYFCLSFSSLLFTALWLSFPYTRGAGTSLLRLSRY